MEFNFILNFIDAVFLQMDFFGMREGPLGSDDPMIKGVILSMLAVAGFGIALNVINSGITVSYTHLTLPTICSV